MIRRVLGILVVRTFQLLVRRGLTRDANTNAFVCFSPIEKRDASAASWRNFSSVRDIRRDDVTMSYDFPPGINLLGDASPANSPRSLSSNNYNSDDEWVHIDASS